MDRRAFLYGTIASIATALILAPTRSKSATIDGLRGSLAPSDAGVIIASADDQSIVLQKAADQAAAAGRPLFLPPGRFLASNLHLPAGLTMIGVPGQTRLVYSGGGRLLSARGGRGLSIDGIIFDGANRGLADETGGLIDFTEVGDLTFSRSEILGSSGHALTLARVSGRIEQCRLTGARGVGIVSTDAGGLDIADNLIADCGSGGILVQRWSDTTDATVLSRNRIERIKALADGTDGHGNGIEVFRARGVVIEANRISDCASAALAVESAADAQITGNQCRSSGGTAIRIADAAEGAMIANNMVDGAVAGLALTGTDGDGRLAAVSGNMVRNVVMPADPADATGGVGIHVDAGAAVNGNVVEGAARIGLRLGWGPNLHNVVASSNIIRNVATGIGVSVVEGVGRTVVTANMISAVSAGGIRGMRWQDFVTDDLTSAAGAFPGLVIEKNEIG